MDLLSSVYDMAVASEKLVLSAAPDYSEHYAVYDKGQFWTADPKGESKIQFAEVGMGSRKELPPTTIPQVFADAVKLKGQKIALRSEQMPALAKGEPIPGPIALDRWTSWTYEAYYNDCRSVAKAMISLGFEAHDAANVLGFNCREWFVANMSAILAGGKSAGREKCLNRVNCVSSCNCFGC